MNAKVMTGKIEGVFVIPKENGSGGHELPEVEVTFDGFVGDKHFGATMKAGGSQKRYPKGTEVRNTRQISIISVEEMDEVAGTMGLPKIEASWVSANLLVSGILELSKLPIGSRLTIGDEVGLVVEEENMPCTTAGRVIQENYPHHEDLTKSFPKRAIGKRGVVGWVERPGRIRKGDEVRVHLPQYA
ncbi:MAG: MOSC domain-containing protein [Chloroflexi bacterium]|nr:MOSC domain-containing protein [Chloroflexota bacterium]